MSRINGCLGWGCVVIGVWFTWHVYGFGGLAVAAVLVAIWIWRRWKVWAGTIYALVVAMSLCGPGGTAHQLRPAELDQAAPALAAQGLSGTTVTPTIWAQALLGDLQDPASSENLRAVTAWERAEGGHWANSARFNPLNTTQTEAGSWSINSVGVQAYPSWDEGMQATLATLDNGRYGGILAALRAGNCASCVAAAVGASPWGTGDFAV